MAPLHHPSESGGGSGSGGSSGPSCYYMTQEELNEAWPWKGSVPSCTGGISDQGSNGSSSSGSSSSGSSSSGSSSSGSSSSGSSSSGSSASSGSRSGGGDDDDSGGGGGGGYNDDAITNVQYDYDSFDMGNCNSYSDLWMWDLALTCDDVTTFEGCQCSTAIELFDRGSLQCAKQGQTSPPACPRNCKVCQTCMVLMGCDDIYHTNHSLGGNHYTPYLLASAVAVGITSMVYFSTSRRSQKQTRHSMGANVALPVHLVPVPRIINANSSTSTEQNHVWLAPMIT